MLIFIPEENANILKENNATEIFNAIEDGQVVASAYMRTDGFFSEIFKVNYPKDKLYLFQGLVRACFNCAANKNAYIGKLTDESCFEQAKTMNFIFDGTCYANDIPTILMGTCCDTGI